MGKVAKKIINPTQKRSVVNHQIVKPIKKPTVNKFKKPKLAPTPHGEQEQEKDENFVSLSVPTTLPSESLTLRRTSSGSNRIKKKDKVKLKKENMLKKIELTKQSFKEEKAKKKREKTAVIGDLRPLADSLPSLDELYKLKSSHTRTGIPTLDAATKKEIKKANAKMRTNEFMNRYDKYRYLLQIGRQRENPRQLVAEHIKRMKMRSQTEDMSM